MDNSKEMIAQIKNIFDCHRKHLDSLFRDYVADILDYVVGWCSTKYHIWET